MNVPAHALPLIIRPLRPRGAGWVQWPVLGEIAYRAYAIERWYNRGQEVQVLSSVEVVGGEGREPRAEFHVSVSGLAFMAEKNYRCSNSRARWAVRQFGFEGYEEDNHVAGGLVRNFWRPIADPLAGQECPCKESEPRIIEGKGDYEWRHVK